MVDQCILDSWLSQPSVLAEHPFPKNSGVAFCTPTPCSFLDRISVRFRGMAMGICPFSHMCISEIRSWCWIRRPWVFQLNPKVISQGGVELRPGFCASHSSTSPVNLGQPWSCLGLLLPVKQNFDARAYMDRIVCFHGCGNSLGKTHQCVSDVHIFCTCLVLHNTISKSYRMQYTIFIQLL